MSHEVTHNESKQRYEIHVDGELAGFADYKQDSEEKTRDFNHTVVDPAFRGQGLSKPLIQEALDDTRNVGYLIIPSCSAVEGFIEKNPEYKDAVKA